MPVGYNRPLIEEIDDDYDCSTFHVYGRCECAFYIPSIGGHYLEDLDEEYHVDRTRKDEPLPWLEGVK